MPTTKDKGGSVSHRHRPVSEYDYVALSQKREYWRTKKREQRARLSEHRRNQMQGSRGKKLCPAVNSTLSGSFGAFSSPSQSPDESYKPAKMCQASHSGNTEGKWSVETTENQKKRCLEMVNLNKVLPQLPASSCSISSKASGGNTVTVRYPTRNAGSRALISLRSSRTQLNTSSSVPPARVTRIVKGNFSKITPQSMQAVLVPKSQCEAQVAVSNQSKSFASNATTGMIFVSPPCIPASIKTESQTVNTTPERGTKSALAMSHRAKGVNNSQSSLVSEEERATKRREHWRIKKREQRAKLAARAKEIQCTERTLPRQITQKTRIAGDQILQHLPSQSFLRRVGQKNCPPRVIKAFLSVKKENKVQSHAGPATVSLQTDQIKHKIPHLAVPSDVISLRKPGESQRKFQNNEYLSNVSKETVRCKTPRHRFIEAHRNFMNQRNIRCKSQFLVSIFGTRNIPKIDPSDTPEQIIAKRREYWRIKKREQRAKLSMEMKARLKEKDSLMRRVKRYQKILEEMRRARALSQSTGSVLTNTSETIGGFIKEDGTVTINIPEVHLKSEEDLRAVSNHNHVRKPHHQAETELNSPVGMNELPSPPRLAQVKVSLPCLEHSLGKPPTLMSDRPTLRESTIHCYSHSSAFGQLTLSHPQTPKVTSERSAEALTPSGCVMKMAVSHSVPSVPSCDPALREDRMAKKREYWRIKKREQRAARAVRLKQGVLQAKANATSEKRKVQKQVTATSGLPDRNLASPVQISKSTSGVAVMTHAHEIKQENEFVPGDDLHFPAEAICADMKPPASPPSPPVPQSECDPALGADSQATTLLAVASMKKLLEESLSTVTDCKNEQADIEIKPMEDASEMDKKPILVGENNVIPFAADQTVETKSWKPGTDAFTKRDSPSSHLKYRAQICETHPPLPPSSETILLPTCEHSSQTPSKFIINATKTTDCTSFRTLCTKTEGYQSCCSPEPPKLHHLPLDQLQQELCEQQQANDDSCEALERSSGLSPLQRKREYWKLMKRQQRARLKARQTGRRDGSSSSIVSDTNVQAPGVINISTDKDIHPPAPKPTPSIASLSTVTSMPTLLVVSPTTCNAENSLNTLQVKMPITSISCSSLREQNKVNVGRSRIKSDYPGASESQQEMLEQQKWMSGSMDVDSTPYLPMLKPPDNPLSSIDLQPIEPPGKILHSPLSPIKNPCFQFESPTHLVEPSTKLGPTSTMVPPKPLPGEAEEDFRRRKREYWRIKKKEQRARKAIHDKGLTPRRVALNRKPILPAKEIQTQDTSQWVRTTEGPEHLTITSPVNDLGSFPCSYLAPVEDEAELVNYESSQRDDGPVSDAVWRNHYLMDYDPLNQLLVCMVCGEHQYSHSLEGVRAHIDEAHPDTLTMHLRDKQRILEAWDEQVSQRERFFTSQLQQQSGGALADTHRDRVN